MEDKELHADSIRAKRHGKELINENSYLHLDKSHKDWYNRSEMGKQRGKPHYAPPKKKK